MSLMVPPEWDWVFILVAGSNWPRGDEDRVRAVARSLYEAGEELGTAGDELRAVLDDVVDYVGESVGHAFARYGQNLVDRQDYYRSTANDLGRMAEEFALQVEAAKYAILVQIAFAAAEIAFIVANPVLMPYYPAFVLAVQRAVRRIMARFVAVVSRLLRYVVRSPVWSDNLARVVTMMLAQAVEEGADEVREDAVVQAIQFAEGNRHTWDGRSTLNALRWGVVAGGFSGMLGGVVHVFRPHLAHNPLVSGVNEAATEVFVGAATVPEGGDPSEIWMGAVNGALSGGLTQGVHNANQGREDRARERWENRVDGPRLDRPLPDVGGDGGVDDSFGSVDDSFGGGSESGTEFGGGDSDVSVVAVSSVGGSVTAVVSSGVGNTGTGRSGAGSSSAGAVRTGGSGGSGGSGAVVGTAGVAVSVAGTGTSSVTDSGDGRTGQGVEVGEAGASGSVGTQSGGPAGPASSTSTTGTTGPAGPAVAGDQRMSLTGPASVSAPVAVAGSGSSTTATAPAGFPPRRATRAAPRRRCPGGAAAGAPRCRPK